MTLYIDTTGFGKVRFTLEHQKKKISKTFLVHPQESDKILVFLDEFLKKSKITPPIPSPLRGGLGRGGIQKIIIYKKNTGSFTGLRIAAAIAQALGMVWQVPVKVIKK